MRFQVWRSSLKRARHALSPASFSLSMSKHQQEPLLPPEDDSAVDLAHLLVKEMGLDENSATANAVAADVVASEHQTAAPGPQPAQGSAGPRRNRRKEKIAAREKARAELVAEAEEEAGHSPNHRKIELEAMANRVAADELQVEEIEPDGNCLFSSIADQLQERHQLVASVHELRKRAADYIRSHRDDFVPFLLNEETGDLKDLDEYTKELETTAMWGGEAEINALSKVFQTPIYVYFGDRDPLEVNADLPEQPLKIAYYTAIYGLGAHYNSLREAVPEAVDSQGQISGQVMV